MQKKYTTSLAPDLKISKIITGLWQIADMERKGRILNLEQAAMGMQVYLDAGLTTFDMADHYGSAEEIAGVFNQNIEPGQVQLLTKWVPEPGKGSKEKVLQAVQRALGRLQVDQLDLMQYHAWNYADPAWLDDLYWLQELKEEGLIRHLGLTNFNAAHLEMVIQSGIEVVSNQICYSPIDQRAAGNMVDICQKYNIKILAFGTLAGGLLSEKWINQPEILADQMATWSQMKYKRFIDVAGGWEPYQLLLKTLQQIAIKHEASIANVATKFILDQPTVGGVIIGARLGKTNYIKDNLRLLELDLSSEDELQIRNSLSLFQSIPGSCGDEYRKPPFLTASGDLSHHLTEFPPPYPVKSQGGNRQKALSGTIWEDLAGFSRAVRIGNRILVSGTTATHGNRLIGGNSPTAQTNFVIDKIEGALQSLGGRLDDVVRTRIYIQNMTDWEAISKVHGQRFGAIQPANTLIRADLVGDGYLVEMEAEAIVET